MRLVQLHVLQGATIWNNCASEASQPLVLHASQITTNRTFHVLLSNELRHLLHRRASFGYIHMEHKPIQDVSGHVRLPSDIWDSAA